MYSQRVLGEKNVQTFTERKRKSKWRNMLTIGGSGRLHILANFLVDLKVLKRSLRGGPSKSRAGSARTGTLGPPSSVVTETPLPLTGVRLRAPVLQTLRGGMRCYRVDLKALLEKGTLLGCSTELLGSVGACCGADVAGVCPQGITCQSQSPLLRTKKVDT